MNGNARYITVTDKDDGLRITIGVDWIKQSSKRMTAAQS